MGFNSTLIVLNDALHQIENDKEFGKKVASAISGLSVGKRGDISSGGHCNAATVIETHHADGIKLIAVGGNCGQDLGYVGGYRSTPLDMLKQLADSLGYNITKKRRAKCTACNGSGYYDHNGSPPCGACNGTGKA